MPVIVRHQDRPPCTECRRWICPTSGSERAAEPTARFPLQRAALVRAYAALLAAVHHEQR